MGEGKYIRGTRKFVNPYSFVSINKKSHEKVSVETDTLKEDLRTGFLNCSMYLKTPIVIPDSEKKEETETPEHYYYPFYSIDGKNPVIPGSSIRGVIRNIYETVTDSCFITAKENDQFTTRIGADDAYKPGLLIKNERGNWNLYEAQKTSIPMEGEGYTVKENRPLYFKIRDEDGERALYAEKDEKTLFHFGELVKYSKKGDRSSYVTGIYKLGLNDTEHNIYKGYLYIGEENSQEKNGMIVPGSKKHEAVFTKRPKKESLKTYTTEELESEINAEERSYRNSAVNQMFGNGHSGYEGFRRAKAKKDVSVLPIWYKCKSDKYYLSLAAVGRVQYKKNMFDKLGVRKPCSDRQLCPACRLFGNVSQNNGYGSKVRFTDALADEKTVEISKKITLKELGAPHVTYFPFYSTINKDFDDKNSEIRGRKYYWHNLAATNNSSLYATNEKTKRNATHDLITPNTSFNFKVYYDGITDEQLEQLIWSLNFWENDTKGKYGPKIGHGKPIGLGSVKIVINDRVERSINDKIPHWNRLAWNEDLSNMISSEDEIAIQLKKICRFDTMSGQDISYGFIDDCEKHSSSDNDYAGHQWYTQNRGTGKASHAQTQLLKDVDEENQQLTSYAYKK